MIWGKTGGDIRMKMWWKWIVTWSLPLQPHSNLWSKSKCCFKTVNLPLCCFVQISLRRLQRSQRQTHWLSVWNKEQVKHQLKAKSSHFIPLTVCDLQIQWWVILFTYSDIMTFLSSQCRVPLLIPMVKKSVPFYLETYIWNVHSVSVICLRALLFAQGKTNV